MPDGPTRSTSVRRPATCRPPATSWSTLPLATRTVANSLPLTDEVKRYAAARHDAAYWTTMMDGQDFNRMDKLDTGRFNRGLWEGLMGSNVRYPTDRHRRQMSTNREALLRAADTSGVVGHQQERR
jgi:hypothetical protein